MRIDTKMWREQWKAADYLGQDFTCGHFPEMMGEIDTLRKRAANAERQLKNESLQASEIFTRLRVENETLQKENTQLHEAAFGEVAGIKEPAIRMQRETIERQSGTIKRLEAIIPPDGIRWLTRGEQDEIDTLRARVAELETMVENMRYERGSLVIMGTDHMERANAAEARIRELEEKR